jgi:hypothetical protein
MAYLHLKFTDKFSGTPAAYKYDGATFNLDQVVNISMPGSNQYIRINMQDHYFEIQTDTSDNAKAAAAWAKLNEINDAICANPGGDKITINCESVATYFDDVAKPYPTV